MKAWVNERECKSCALCVDKCPSVFRFNGANNKSHTVVESVPKSRCEAVKLAAYECPASAIKLNM